MGQAVQQCRRHLRVPKHARPFPKGEVGCDQDRGALVQPADQVEEQLSARLSEGQVAELVEHHEVHPAEVVSHPLLPARPRLALQPVYQINDIEEAAPRAAADAGPRDPNRQMAVITHPLTGTCFWCKLSRLRQYRTATALKVIIAEMPVVRRVAKPFCSPLLERYWSEAEHLSNELGFAV